MPTLSLKKIFTAIFGTLFLIHLKDILRGVQPAYFWLCDSLSEIKYFEEGAQAAIAVTTIVLIVVLALRVFNK
jgi:hypothetical protein